MTLVFRQVVGGVERVTLPLTFWDQHRLLSRRIRQFNPRSEACTVDELRIEGQSHHLAGFVGMTIDHKGDVLPRKKFRIGDQPTDHLAPESGVNVIIGLQGFRQKSPLPKTGGTDAHHLALAIAMIGHRCHRLAIAVIPGLGQDNG